MRGMATKLGYVTLDCVDAGTLAPFWAAALGWDVTWQDDEGAVLEGPEPAAPKLFLQIVPEPKRVKNRAHLDLVADDYSADLDRITALGGTVLNVNSTPDGTPSAVMADPEGNEFCLS